MSKKRTLPDSNDDEQTTEEDSDSLFQEGNNTKRAKLASLSDTTLEDLPMELLESILVKVVATEVKDMRLAKSVWKAKADLVIDRLGTVCPHWTSILTTNFFRNELHRALDGTAQPKIRVEILHQSQIPFFVFRVTTLRDEMFMICKEENIVVYNRSTMAQMKDITSPSDSRPLDVTACNVSNCVYVLALGIKCFSLLRITKDEEDEYNISPWIADLDDDLPLSSISATATGDLIILSRPRGENAAAVSVYDASGCMQRKITFSPDNHVLGFRLWQNAIQKPDGNVVVFAWDEKSDTIREIDSSGCVERQYVSSKMPVQHGVYSAGIPGRYVITEMDKRIKLLDSELNLLDFTGPQFDVGQLYYDSGRNEVIGSVPVSIDTSALTIFRFVEE